MKGRVLRLSAATLLLGAAGTTIAPHLMNYVSSSAVVNAPLLTVRAPFSGRLVESSPGFASSVHAGQRLLQLDGERQDKDALAAVQAEARATQAELGALIAQIAEVTGVEADLRQRIAAHDRASGLYLAAERQRLRIMLEGAENQRDQAEAERERVARMVERGATPRMSLEEAETQGRVARLAAEEIAARIEAVDIESGFLVEGTATDVSVDGGITARQRLDQVILELVDLTSRRDTLKGRLTALDEQIAALGADFASRTTFTPEAAAAAVIWRAAPATGTSVMAGDTLMELLDCQNRFVEVALPGRLFESIRPGDPATIRLKGSPEPVAGVVKAVGGAGARFDHPSFASDPAEIDAGDLQVLVRLDPADPSRPEVAGTFCDVGRTAEVRFQRDRTAALSGLISVAALFRDWAQGNSTGTGFSDSIGSGPGAS